MPLSAAAERGRQVASENGCGTCHTVDGSRSTGPSWKGLAGSKVALDGDDQITADEAYLRRAIVEPKSEVVEGYANLMPRYPDLTSQQVDDLVEYLRALAT